MEKQCLTNLVEKSGFEVVQDNKYKSLERFRESSESLLDDIALPFQAPCIVADEKIVNMDINTRRLVTEVIVFSIL